MKLTENEIKELLMLPFDEFCAGPMSEAKKQHRENCNKLTVTALMGYSNVCKNKCLYCGMSSKNVKIDRYRVPTEDIVSMAETVADQGLKRIFLVSGEDPHYKFEDILKTVEKLNNLGFFITAACGEFDAGQYAELKAAGLDEYVMKFEMSDKEDFDRLNPSTCYEKRMASIQAVKNAGLLLGSGSIIDYPGCTLEKQVNDILLTAELNVSWAPVIPFMPAKGTVLENEPRGNYETNLRVLSILRLLLPDARITAQQPGKNPADGLGGKEGNLAALNAGADILFTDLLPSVLSKNFTVVDNRLLGSLDFIKSLAEEAGMDIKTD